MAKIKAKGVVLKYGASASPTTTIPQKAEVSFDQGALERVDTTTHDTSGITKTYEATLKEPPSIEVRVLLDPADTAHDFVITNAIAGTLVYFTLVLPDAGAAEWALSGHITNLQIGPLLVNNMIETTFTFSAAAAGTYTK